MELSEIAVRIIILVIPGLIFFNCHSVITGKKEKTDWGKFFDITFVSIICYLIISINPSFVSNTLVFSFDLSTNLKALYSENVNPNYFEIIIASVVGIILAFSWAKFVDKKVLNAIATKLKINYRTGRDDVWDDFLTLEKDQYLVVRDHKTGYTYYGYVSLYSEACEKRELVLSNVIVYTTSEMKEIDQVEKLYLSRNENEIDFELPQI